MKIACSTIGYTEKSLAEALQRISSLGFKYVDLLMVENWAHINPSEIAKAPQQHATQVSELLDRYALTAIGINGNVSASLTSQAPTEIKSNQNQAEGLIRFAHQLSISLVVLQPGSVSEGAEFDTAMDASVDALRAMALVAEKYGITLAIEAHVNSLAEKYDDALHFVEAVPGLKLAYDPSHFVMVGYELPSSEVLLPDVAHVHLRNAVRGNFQASMADGILDFGWVLDALDRHGYAGAVAIEYLDGRDVDIEPEILALKELLGSRYRI